jgi:hypothetical protein
MDRRRFVVQLGTVLLVLPASRVLIGCGGGGGDGNGADAGTDAGTNQQAYTFTSSVDAGHTHTFQLQATELSTPPAGGIERDTSTDSGHIHMVELTEADLNSIDDGNTVTKTASVVGGHSHTFTFKK